MLSDKCLEELLQSSQGNRFLELHALLKEFLLARVCYDSTAVKHVAGQLLNVLKNCDQITYEAPGTAEAYALLHFLDRYHRFQIIFENLHTATILPTSRKKIDVLDVGTGPGPSMYAASDFYSNLKRASIQEDDNTQPDVGLSIDYVERSSEFRNWLHHFTEHVNYYCPSKQLWHVPYHHGSFFDFQGLEFNQKRTRWDYDDDGDQVAIKYTEKYRFDLVVFSNFLTTQDQVSSFAAELRNCVRFLRNNGILVVVGAKSTSSHKYRMVYEEIVNAILTENYSNWKFVASCKKVDIANPVMGYSWGDCYGEKIKELIREVYEKIREIDQDSIPTEVSKIIEKTIEQDYTRPIEWEVHVFRKRAMMRRRNKPAQQYPHEKDQ